MNQIKHKVGGDFTTEMPCPVCSSLERRYVSEIGRNFKSLETVICKGCGLLHSNPIPSKVELDTFYEKKYRSSYKFARKPRLKHILRYAPGALERVETVLSYKKPEQIKLIDIGSGSGEFLYMAHRAGFDARGIEPHTGYCEYTKQELGLNVLNTTLEQAGLEKDSFDIINLNHVLEHMPDPLDTLSRLHSLLRKDGLLMVDVPDISICSHAPWTQFHYAHLYNFNHLTLKALVEKAGFEILNPQTTTTNLVARKSTVARADALLEMSQNFDHMWETLNIHTGVGHYKTKKPYLRFIRKCYQYPKEFFIVAFLRSPRKILDQIYDSRRPIIEKPFIKEDLSIAA